MTTPTRRPDQREESPRGRGRPRSPATDEAILDAVRELLASEGWAALTVEGVAARAGVAKTTVYRRFASRTDLAVAAVAGLVAAAASTRPGATAAEDVENAIRCCAAIYGRPAARAAYLAVVGEASRDPALRAAVERDVIAPARQMVVDGLDRAVARGELSRQVADERQDLVYDVIAGALMHRLLVREAELDDVFIAALTGSILEALRN